MLFVFVMKEYVSSVKHNIGLFSETIEIQVVSKLKWGLRLIVLTYQHACMHVCGSVYLFWICKFYSANKIEEGIVTLWSATLTIRQCSKYAPAHKPVSGL